MTVTVMVNGKAWFSETGVTDLTLLDEYLVLYDKEGNEHSILMEKVTGFVVTDI